MFSFKTYVFKKKRKDKTFDFHFMIIVNWIFFFQNL